MDLHSSFPQWNQRLCPVLCLEGLSSFNEAWYTSEDFQSPGQVLVPPWDLLPEPARWAQREERGWTVHDSWAGEEVVDATNWVVMVANLC